MINSDEGLALPDCEVVRARTFGNRDNKPGIVKMELKSLNEKIKVLRAKSKLRQHTFP